MPAAKPIEHHRRVGRANGTKKANGSPIRALSSVPPADPIQKNLDPKTVMDQILAAGGHWLATTDAVALALLRETLEERADVRERIMNPDSPLPASRSELRDLDKQITSLLSALGFDPTARSRLGVAEVTRVSKLAEIQRKTKP